MDFIQKTIAAYVNKVSNRLYGTVYVRHTGKKHGDALLSYLVSPFTQTPWESHTDPHASYWECKEIARLLSVRGYDVTVIEAKNNTFIPKKKYSLCIDIQNNLTRLAPLLPKDCKKIMHVVSSYTGFQNQAESKRIDELEKRRGVRLKPRRVEVVNDNPAHADIMEGFGNKTVYATYAQYKKEIYPIAESVSREFDFPTNKDFAKSAKHFMWFGGGGAVHKGLDLVLEAWTTLPTDLHLHILGPISVEDDFVNEYRKELSLPNVTLHGRPKINKEGVMMLGSLSFTEVANMCSSLLYFSCSEGTSGAVVQAMHAGLIPVITPETGIYEDAPCITISAPTVSDIENQVLKLSKLTEQELRSMSQNIWNYARNHYTKEKFTETYSAFLDTILKSQ